MLIVMSMVTFVLFFAVPGRPGEASPAARTATPAQIEQTRKALGYDKPVIVQWADFLKGSSPGRRVPRRRGAPQGGTRAGHRLRGPVPRLLAQSTSTTVNDEIKDALPDLGLPRARRLRHLDHRRRPVRRHRRADQGHVPRPRPRRPDPGLLRVPDVLHRPVPLQATSPSSGSLVASTPPTRRSRRAASVGWLSSLFLPGADARPGLHGRLRPDDPGVRAGVDDRGLHPHRQGQGPERRARCSSSTAMRAALTPLVTMAGLDLAGLLGGAIITETVFNYHGLGQARRAGASRDLRPAD